MATGLGPAEHRRLTPGHSRRGLLCVGAPLLVGLVHVALVARWYHVGSFDDDAGYILGARAIAAGRGLSAPLLNGTVVAGSAPPGYPALLAPLVGVAGAHWLALRLVSVGCFAACFPLLWTWLGRRGASTVVRTASLGLLALNPVAATFGSMVMAEMPFLVVLLVMLLAVDRWGPGRRAGVVVVACAVALVWLKEAAVAIDAGVVLWLWLRRQWGKGAVVAAGVALSLVPVAVARVVAGVPIAGSRYSQELGAYYSGGLRSRLLDVLPAAAHRLASVALPASVVPRGSPLWGSGAGAEVLRVVSWQVTVFVVVGFVVWVRRSRDVTTVLVPLYGLESLLWPYINERRVVLVLPVVLAWYSLGVWTAAHTVVGRLPPARVPLALLGAAAVGVPLLAQLPRDYLYSVGQSSSEPQGSRYMALLAAAPAPGDVVESDYTSTAALFSGHRSAESAFLANNPLAAVLHCLAPSTDEADLRADGAGWVLTGDLNKPDRTDNPCVLQVVSDAPWAVRLLRSGRDLASVFELIGPGTVHPDLLDLTAGEVPMGSAGPAGSLPLAAQDPSDRPGSAPETPAVAGSGTLTWRWPAAAVTQVSVGGARCLDGPTGPVALQLAEAGRWVTVASAPHGVGDRQGAPYLLTRLPAGTVASGVRVVVAGTGRVVAVDLHVLGRR